jgi:hypothetical protein
MIRKYIAAPENTTSRPTEHYSAFVDFSGVVSDGCYSNPIPTQDYWRYRSEHALLGTLPYQGKELTFSPARKSVRD